MGKCCGSGSNDRLPGVETLLPGVLPRLDAGDKMNAALILSWCSLASWVINSLMNSDNDNFVLVGDVWYAKL